VKAARRRHRVDGDFAEPDVKRRCTLALAAALVVSADAWLAKDAKR